ncbi:FecR family protein [Chitinophaga niabensis]|uniref:FecR protein n=1 Tax=Chitinophaga niabensis TaxID=536979 RepID=A0A1N6DCM0_9BACT|nr:FecR family protein [Chitinophaga niabensis]SIN68394.1 FecR protein [Chitinophaga niabensis]
MDNTRIYYLAGQYLKKSLTETEQAEFQHLLHDPEHQEAFQTAFEEMAGELDMNIAQDKDLLPLLERSLNSDRVQHRIRFLPRRRLSWAAASIILLLAAGAYFRTTQKKNMPQPAIATVISPGKQGAILTLADGSQVVLDSLGNGVVAKQNGASIVLMNGQLAYDPAENASGEIVFNTISTPKGRQFQVTLPDGTRVWLNAASSLRYPTAFAGKEREVEITGEAYFEVAKNAQMPFMVSVNNKAGIQVLGTHFNVNAYKNENAIATTLLEGSVRVAQYGTTSGNVILQPGQQAQITGASGIKVIENANIDKVIAWKNGLFHFEGTSLAEIMRQLERWYDIEVVYEKGIPDIEFEGEMTKDVSLNGLLVMLGKTELHFRIEGRKLIVYE